MKVITFNEIKERCNQEKKVLKKERNLDAQSSKRV